MRLFLPLLLFAALCRAQDLSERQIAHLKAALSKDDRDALIRHSDSWGAPALAWIRSYHPKIATWLEHYALCRKLAESLDKLAPPGWTDKKFVRLTWPRLAKVAKPLSAVHRFHHGWLLKEDAKSVTLLGRGLVPNRHRLVRDPPSTPVDFKQFCLDYLAHPPIGLNRDVEHLRLGGMGDEGDACALAYYALKLDHKDIAVRLVAGVAGPNLERRVAKEIVRTLSWQVAQAAYGGTPRSDLRGTVARVPKGGYAEAALGHYDSLIREDEKWVDPTPPDLAVMTKGQQARIWLHRLRDHRARVSERDRDFAPLFGHELNNPMRALLKLDWAAVPALIERLGDKRPTRSVLEYTQRPFKGRLVTHGECCAAVLQLIAGRHFDKAGDAVAWWADAKDKGAEVNYRALLADYKTRAIGIRGLARLDFAKHREELTKLCEKDVRYMLALGEEVNDEDLFVGWLKEARTRGTAAIILWRQFGSDRGAKEMIRAVRAWQAKGLPQKELLFGLGRIHTDEVARALVEFVSHENEGLGAMAAITAADYPHPLVARTLRDKMKVDFMPLRNNAAIGLALMIRYPEEVTLHVPAGFVRQLAEWYDDRKDVFDWEELRNDAAR